MSKNCFWGASPPLVWLAQHVLCLQSSAHAGATNSGRGVTPEQAPSGSGASAGTVAMKFDNAWITNPQIPQP